MSTSGNDPLESAVVDALDRAALGHAVYVSVTPTVTMAMIKEALQRHTAARRFDAVIVELDAGVVVRGRHDD